MSGWTQALAAAHDEGFLVLDLLTAVDHGEELEVVARVQQPTGPARLLSTRIPADAPRLPTATAHYPAANWYEREAAEMFGIVFDGHPDPRPLLLREPVDAPPLRRSVLLEPRLATAWPGAAEPSGERRGSRRRLSPPGVPEGWTPGASSGEVPA